MKLKTLSYSEHTNTASENPWKVNGLSFSDNFNLLVGKNATGKTRVISLINNLAKILNLEIPLLNGHWDILFSDEGNEPIGYELEIADKMVVKEVISLGKKVVLHRNTGTKIYSMVQKENISIDPPKDKLVMHIRRDEKEYPYFEKIMSWAKQTKGFRFGDVDPRTVEIPGDATRLIGLNAVPSIVDSMKPETLKMTIQDFNTIGYSIENIKTDTAHGLPPMFRFLFMKEKDITHPIKQNGISQGMFRALALLAFVNHFLDVEKDTPTFLVDDLGEGLDYERATKLTKLIHDKVLGKKVQFIATTNDSFLMNVVDISCWNILFRDAGNVFAYNYENSRKSFDEFKLTGLSNFDLLSSDFLSKLTKSK